MKQSESPPQSAVVNPAAAWLEEYSGLVLVASRWEAMCELLDGKEVSDFMLSFPEVRQVSDMVGYGGVKR